MADDTRPGLEQGKIRQVREYCCGIHAEQVPWPLVAASGIGAEAG